MLNCCIQKRAQGMKNSQDALDAGDTKGNVPQVAGFNHFCLLFSRFCTFKSYYRCECVCLCHLFGAVSSPRPPDSSADPEDEEEEEFFDAPDEDPGEPAAPQQPRRLPWNQPEGRLKPCGTLSLLETPDRLYIPVTQVRGAATRSCSFWSKGS